MYINKYNKWNKHVFTAPVNQYEGGMAEQGTPFFAETFIFCEFYHKIEVSAVTKREKPKFSKISLYDPRISHEVPPVQIWG